jgi:hypothetical protein
MKLIFWNMSMLTRMLEKNMDRTRRSFMTGLLGGATLVASTTLMASEKKVDSPRDMVKKARRNTTYR